MILTKNIEVKVVQTKYWLNQGLDVKNGDIIHIPPSLLPPNSSYKVLVECDICQIQYELTYKNYLRNIKQQGFLTCKKCNHIKTKKTKQEKYGDENYNNQEQIRQTKQEKYGDENYNNREKAKQTNLIKYETEHPLQNPLILSKVKETKLKKYGIENYNNQEQIKATCYQKYQAHYYLGTTYCISKSKETKLKKYGDENYNNTPKRIKTNFQKYGVAHPIQNPKIKAKIQQQIHKTIHDKNLIKYELYNIIDYRSNKFIHQCEKGHISILTRNLLRSRIQYNIPLCKKCYPSYDSLIELKVLKIIKEYYKGTIIRHERNQIGLELDIFLPELKIAIEINGLYWHSDKFKNPNYHQDKLTRCLQNQIRLYQVWEDDWVYRYENTIEQLKNLFKENKLKVQIGDLFDPNEIDYRTLKEIIITKPNMFYIKNNKRQLTGDNNQLKLYDSGYIYIVKSFKDL